MKTNALRQLDSAKIKYEILNYDLPFEDFDGEKVANELGIEAKACYKTLAVHFNNDVYLCVISVGDELDLKKSAKAIGVKNIEMVHVKDLLKTIGYERGSVSPLGAKKNKGVYFDDEVMNHEIIEISGGAYGIGIKIQRDILLKFLNAKVKDLIKDEI